ncbi:hypothetical protein JD969_04425 [Planctomycetota bacterium]|nr:hypothetical protein JD969_04425 [Planctomycetota bacterium]
MANHWPAFDQALKKHNLLYAQWTILEHAEKYIPFPYKQFIYHNWQTCIPDITLEESAWALRNCLDRGWVIMLDKSTDIIELDLLSNETGIITSYPAQGIILTDQGRHLLQQFTLTLEGPAYFTSGKHKPFCTRTLIHPDFTIPDHLLTQYNLSPLQYFLLEESIAYHPIHWIDFLTYTYLEHDPENQGTQATIDRYLQALQECIDRKFITALTSAKQIHIRDRFGVPIETTFNFPAQSLVPSRYCHNLLKEIAIALFPERYIKSMNYQITKAMHQDIIDHYNYWQTDEPDTFNRWRAYLSNQILQTPSSRPNKNP